RVVVADFAAHDQCLDQASSLDAEQRNNLVYALCIGGFHQAAAAQLFRSAEVNVGDAAAGHLHVGGVAAAGAEDNLVLAGVCQHVEFVRHAATDIAGVCQHRTEVQAQAFDYATVGLVHHIIGLL